jgi:hypothetical protein
MFVPSGAALLVKDGSGLSEIYLNKNKRDALDDVLRYKQILVNKQGIYTSYRAVFTKAAMFYGRDITFRKAGFEWHGFTHLFEDSVRWILILKEAALTCSTRRKISREEAETKLARFLSTLGLNARDPDYIRSWWTNFETLLTEYGISHLYNVEHPRSPEDVRKIYHGIKSVLPEIVADEGEADRTYIASLFIQNLRQILLKRRPGQLDPDLYPLYRSLEGEKTHLIEQSPTFTVQQTFYVQTASDVEPLTVVSNYKDFISAEHAGLQPA